MVGNTRFFGVDFRVCIDRIADGLTYGSVYSRCLNAPMPFTDLGRLLLRLDEVMDVRNFPQAFLKMRMFHQLEPDVKPVSEYALKYAAVEPGEEMSLDAVAAAYGEALTFSIHIVSRRSASWQGQLNYLDGVPLPFESTLELLRMLNEAINDDT